MDETFKLILLALVMLIGSYLAGSIPLVMSLSEEMLQLVSVLGAGLLVGTALSVIIPEGVRSLLSVPHSHLTTSGEGAHNEDGVVITLPEESGPDVHSLIGVSLVLGFVFMLLVDQCSSHRSRGENESKSERSMTATLGLVVHAAADGIALGAAAHTAHTDVEMIVFVAIMLHKAPAAFGLVTFLLHEGLERNRIRRHLIIFSVSAPLLALLTYFGLGQDSKDTLSSVNATGLAMLFSAGTFLYVATVHVLPELTHKPHSHTHQALPTESGGVPNAGKERSKGYARGVTFCLLWYLSILAGFYLLYCPLLPLLILAPDHYRNFTEILFVIWETYPVALMEIVMGTQMVIVGDVIDPEDRALIVMNHRTRLDWNFLWAAMFHGTRPAAHRLKFVLKSGVRHFPGLGWIMQMTCFLYINRNWNADQHLMGKVLEYFRDIHHRCQILLFPEGTDLTVENKVKSDRFADKNGLPKFQRVLHPKTTGFAFLTQRLRNNGQLDAVYDVTIAYPGTVSQTEMDMARGKFPEQVHFRIKRHDLSTLPMDETSCRKWLNSVWTDKENSLEDFYKNLKFPSEIPRVHEGTGQSRITNALHLSFVAWTSLTIFACYAIFNYLYFQIWVLLITLFFVTLSFTCDGLQHLEIALYSTRKHNKKYQ